MDSLTNIRFTAKLESDYAVMRKIQATHDLTEYRCIGSGKCCRIGLQIPLAECFNIAQQLKRKYYLMAEAQGFAEADSWFKSVVDALISRMFDASWEPNGETEQFCAFFVDRACSIYEFRPMVCRAYGVIMPVAIECPRKRQADNTNLVYADAQIEALIKDWESNIATWSKAEAMNYTVYMPMGVLRYLLKDSELKELHAKTDSRFWNAMAGNLHRFYKESWTDD